MTKQLYHFYEPENENRVRAGFFTEAPEFVINHVCNGEIDPVYDIENDCIIDIGEVVIVVPERISNLNLKIQLIKRDIELEDIVAQINEIPEYMFTTVDKKIAIAKYNQAVYFDRYNADLMLVAYLMGLDEDDLNEIFIQGNL